MSIWNKITQALSALASGEAMSAIFDRRRTPPERSVAFAISVVALGAKMAKADGLVTRNEVRAFRTVFHIAPEDAAGAAHVFNLAKQDVAGFEAYAHGVREMFRHQEGVLCDLMEGLFHIAMADGFYHPRENDFLTRVAEIFGLKQRDFMALRARFVPDAEQDPYVVLAISPDSELTEIKAAWRALVQSCHPDVMIARGLPQEAVKIAEKRLIDVNAAWKQIQHLRLYEQS
jgi:DnaJ like chaperone protein